MNEVKKSIRAERSISRQFIISILLIVVSLVGVIIFMTSYLLTQAYDSQVKSEIDRTSSFIQKTVYSFVHGTYNLSYELAVNPSILTMDSDIQIPILESSVSRNDYLELLYIQGMDGMQTARSSGILGDRSNRWWFLQMLEKKQPFVSKSYYSVGTNMPCTSVFIPMYTDSEMIGVFGADIKLGYIQQLIEQFSDQNSGLYSFIIDGDGVVMAHPDSKYLEILANYKTLTRTVSEKDTAGNAVKDANGNVATIEEPFTISDSYKTAIHEVMNGISGMEIIQENGSLIT